jgi:hypothetical protein
MSTTTRLFAALAVSLGSALSIACSAADPGAPIGQRVGAQNGGMVDSGTGPAPVTMDEAGSLAPDSAAAPDTSTATSDASDASDAPLGEVLSLTLVDTSITNVIAGSPVAGYDPLKNNSTFSLGTVGTQLSIRANINPTATANVASVLFAYDATNHTENATPYTLCGDDGAGTINNCNLTAGQHTLTVTTYSAAALGGTAGTPYTITFTIAP